MEKTLQKSLGKNVVKNCELNGYNISEALYPPKLRQPRHTHRFASFSFVLAGNYLENYGGQSQTRQSSTVIFHPPQESHAVDYGSETVQILSVELGFEKLDYIRQFSLVLDSSASCRTEKVNYLGHRIYQEFRQMDSVSPLAIEGLIFEILAEAIRSRANITEKNLPRWLEQTKDFLHDNFTESFVIGDIAKIASVHPVHLSRVFREKFGCTIGEYVRRLRVEFASKQIASTENPLSEIAHAAGFADQSHLNKTFKTIFGLTPAEHRKLSRRC
jgi:AraC family transcriptional regulator